MGMDTHALSEPSQEVALQVLAANGVETVIQRDGGFTPTPVISRAIIVRNRGRKTNLADGIVITPSHNPPEDGGFKYNPPNGGPADTDVTRWIQNRANELLAGKEREIKRTSLATAIKAPKTHQEDLVTPYVEDLDQVVDMDAIREAGVTIGVDPLGGASLPYWEAIASRWRLNITIVNKAIDPRFAFMTLDHDGKIRMDCSSPYAMASLVSLKDRFQVAVGNDPDSDRHGIVTASSGLMNPNHYLAVAIDYLLTNRPAWPAAAAIGKTIVSSSMIDLVTSGAGRRLAEVPVGFKWFAEPLFEGKRVLRRRGERRRELPAPRWHGVDDRQGWVDSGSACGRDHCADRQGSGRALQAAGSAVRIAVLHPHRCAGEHGAESAAAETLSRRRFCHELAGEPITNKLTTAPENDAPIDGLKVMTASGWFAARPSGTEDIYKIYAESFKSAAHLQEVVSEAQRIVDQTLSK